ncbi:leucine-rich repeat receptor-like serine/threonine-protein kinase At2g14510 isoform X2 [Brachypodium distachyon]|uniref:leucine-rich repeat receptor-like serine/threonine-protein kinase At2g14510 isoform X2 n=1 Tax=Brachypodium distachyon TaxID=15368 RepID=UPI000D0DBBD9|nr:leucine-rich repeat receptor-like serine/threonine-protein kinase At2g14510 isoform X2 [Brachypodium distachyon]|eukprot:XP_024314920.1 leucine-rich repeat receptor-like serine/threonine-protein kinase At2g14510 isoform X2 [Brachypodium distachyon]
MPRLLALLAAAALFLLLPLAAGQRFRGFSYLLDCGAPSPTTDRRGLSWNPDGPYVSAGTPRELPVQGLLDPTLGTLRAFPHRPAAKFCYTLPVDRNRRYLLRPTFFYGSSSPPPPVFDLIVDGTFWTAVDTTADSLAGSASHYEAVFPARGRSMTFCLGVNPNYTDSGPFINALQVIQLDDSVYNATDFGRSAMGLIARTKFGSTGDVERYPDDSFDRYWQPFSDSKHAVSSTHNVTSADFWNLPPPDVFNTALVAKQNAPLVLQWPPMPLQNDSYYVALYFADTLADSSRTFDVYINDYSFFKDLPVTSAGLSVFATQWILSGLTRVILTSSSVLPPLINAGEVFGLFPIGKLTITRDALALESVKRNLQNIPDDWIGDPCMPRGYAWTGVTCDEGEFIRIVSLNFSSMGISGSLSPDIANLTALTNISFANNSLSGPIPDLSKLNKLQRLHLYDNKLNGTIPQTLGTIQVLRELIQS